MTWRAFVTVRDGDAVHAAVSELDDDELGEGTVEVGVEWSAVNYKDAMVTVPKNRVARISPLVPGVDLTGTVRASGAAGILPGTRVVVHGYDLGVAHHGGFAEAARVPASWVVALPEGLSTRRAAAVGTAGFTAVVSLQALRRAGVEPGTGPVLVTGASGGVGSMAVAALAHAGYEVVASTGKAGEHDYLRRLGAATVVGRDVLDTDGARVLGTERWAGAVDCVGGPTLAGVLRTLRYGGAVAASGLTGGAELATTVYPFIVRAVSLLGVDSVAMAIDERRALWQSVGEVLPAELVDATVAAEVPLEGLESVLADVLAARVRGRVLVRPGSAGAL